MEEISLKDILSVFNVPLSEEQAWAVCFQCAKHLQWKCSENPKECFVFKGIETVLINKDGCIADVNVNQSAGTSEAELIESLGLVIYQALDYGLAEDEEHELSPNLEALIGRMTDSDEGEGTGHDVSIDDEGIENDVEDQTREKISLDDILEACSAHLDTPNEAVSHYRAVCRALVAEATELTTFLERVSDERERLHLDDSMDTTDQTHLEELQRGDWARLWIQMMRELRNGVKLRKVDTAYIGHSIEFELTPYEILMEDIRTRRYRLNKVMTEGQIPLHTRKDAHFVMLEFIRSRPPLHSAKDRKLGTPPPVDENPRDQLLKAIRSDPKLRPTPGNLSVEASRNQLDESETQLGTPPTTKKIIKPNFNICFSDDDDDDDVSFSESEDDVFDDKNKVTPSPLSPLSPLSPPTLGSTSWQQTVVYDLVTLHTPEAPRRRYSIGVCETPDKSMLRGGQVVTQDGSVHFLAQIGVWVYCTT